MVLFNWEDKWVYTFPKGICPKVNVIVRLEFELAYYDSAVQRFNHDIKVDNLPKNRINYFITKRTKTWSNWNFQCNQMNF